VQAEKAAASPPAPCDLSRRALSTTAPTEQMRRSQAASRSPPFASNLTGPRPRRRRDRRLVYDGHLCLKSDNQQCASFQTSHTHVRILHSPLARARDKANGAPVAVAPASRLPPAEDDAPLGQVVGRDLAGDAPALPRVKVILLVAPYYAPCPAQ